MTLDEWAQEKRNLGWTWADITHALYEKSGEFSEFSEEGEEDDTTQST